MTASRQSAACALSTAGSCGAGCRSTAGVMSLHRRPRLHRRWASTPACTERRLQGPELPGQPHPDRRHHHRPAAADGVPRPAAPQAARLGGRAGAAGCGPARARGLGLVVYIAGPRRRPAARSARSPRRYRALLIVAADLVPARVLRGWRPADPVAGALGAVLPGLWPMSLIGLGYLSVSRGLLTNYSPGQRIQSVVVSLVGFSGPVQFNTGQRRGSFRLRDWRTRLVHPGGRGLHVPAAGRAGRAACRRPTPTRIRELLARHGDQDSLGYFALRERQEHHLVAVRQGLHRLPGAVRRDARQRRPDRRPRGVAGRHPHVPGRGGPARVGARRSLAAASLAPRSGAGKAT